MKTPETIAIIPAHNEESRINPVVHAALRATLVDAVVIVDDGSTDGTLHAALQGTEEAQKPIVHERYAVNQGKTEALITGVNGAKILGGSALSTLVFLDADSSPIWIRDTKDNMKLWQLGLTKILGGSAAPVTPDTLKGRTEVFINMLAHYIDEIVQPVASLEEVMRTGMYQRNIITDTILTAFSNKGGHAGNRAVSIDIWNNLMELCATQDVSLDRWGIEAALNTYTGDHPTGTFLMHGVINVGSRVKSGGIWSGIKRMVKVHGQAPATKRQVVQALNKTR